MTRILALLVLLVAAWPVRGETLVLSQGINDPLPARALLILREAYRRLGITIETEQVPNERAIVLADSGQTSGDLIRIAGLSATYPNLIQVPEPVVTFESTAFTAGLTFPVKGWESLRPYRLCVLRGNKLAEINTEGMNREIVGTIEGMGRMVIAGHCEVAVLGRQVWLEVDRHGLRPLISLDPPIQVVPLYHYVHRRHADLVPRLAKVLKELNADGTSARLVAADDHAIEEARRRAR
ncbi:substrate-binding periplasmic protein [Magnetospirillum moscoviense]|uniref:substrate-binding periplasmic protein n=1 Tax=Magnetospirillum moscoviense TaxID=1437059 RepID=UPI000AADCEEC|nr:hypothetical protein [Magnetospirillum moscoviense]MBF0324283.1 hypothetical protein [Alphaproteobacteria bacterium]